MDSEALIRRGGAVDRAARWVAVVGFTGLMAVAIITMADVLLRWLFSAPLIGLEDVNRYTFALVIATCLPAGLVQGHNITIRFLGSALGARATLYLEVLGALATLAFFALLFWRFVVFAYDETVAGHYTVTLQMATAPWWWSVTAVMAAAVAVQCLVAIVQIRRALTRRFVIDGSGGRAGEVDRSHGKFGP